MQLNPYLHFNGDCGAAFKFYEQSLGAKIQSSFTFGGSPAEQQVPPEWKDKILHAAIAVGGTVVMGSDVPHGRYQRPSGFAVSLSTKDPAEAERLFNALADGGTVQMPLQQTFWAPRFGMVVDRFGIPWMINCEPSTA